MTETIFVDTDKAKVMEKCCSFWDDIPTIKQYNYNEIYDKVINQSPRFEILDILVEGIEEGHGDEQKIRRALSATEILDRLNGNEKKGIKGKLVDKKVVRNNLYYHLNSLIENNILYEVCKLESGRRSTTYFGRIAKIVVPDTDYRKEDKSERVVHHPDFKRLAKKIYPKLQNDEINKVISLVDRKNQHNNDKKIIAWMEMNEEKFEGLELDFRKLYELLSILYRYDEKTVEGLTSLRKILKLDW